jgi:hypothetical protein
MVDMPAAAVNAALMKYVKFVNHGGHGEHGGKLDSRKNMWELKASPVPK